ncbi:MAG: alpha/beta hydrolase [Acidimicrobiales bacterium]|nr:alpha/beta hydrolase [Acidimicrobiales bacterium]
MITRTLTIDGGDGAIDLCIAESGQGGRPLLLVHGFTGAKEDFTDFVDPLAELGWHVVAPDQRGHGESAKPVAEEAYSFERYVDDLLALLDALGWGRCVALGHSMGGMVVQTAIGRAPGRFAGLVLMDTSHRPLRADSGVIDLAVGLARTEGMEGILAVQAAMDGQGPEAQERLLATRPGYREFGDRKMRASSPAMYATMLQAITDPARAIDRLDDLRSVKVPTLVLVGEQDAPFLRPSERMAAAIAGAELVVIPGAAHSPQFEAQEAWWEALTSFLGRLPAVPGASG